MSILERTAETSIWILVLCVSCVTEEKRGSNVKKDNVRVGCFRVGTHEDVYPDKSVHMEDLIGTSQGNEKWDRVDKGEGDSISKTREENNYR